MGRNEGSSKSCVVNTRGPEAESRIRSGLPPAFWRADGEGKCGTVRDSMALARRILQPPVRAL